MQLDIVCTTISDGTFLKTWERLIREANRQEQVRLLIIPDKNTPPALYAQARDLAGAGINAVCPAPDEQVNFLAELGCRDDFIPWCSDNRRNVGYLMSWAGDADAMISVDDDNLPLAETWFGGHEAVTHGPARDRVTSADSGWFNNCSLLATRPAPIWPRGFPYFARHAPELTRTWEDVQIAINAGLWLGDPDVDAITRTGARPHAWAVAGESAVLARDTWTPINTQNTAIRRAVIPAWYFPRMPGWGGRWGDILSGYFAQACAKHLGHSVRVGTPLVRQDRNPHSQFDDLGLEWPFIQMTEQFAGWLPTAELEGHTYHAAYESLSHALDAAAGDFPSRERDYLHQVARDMRYWLTLTGRL